MANAITVYLDPTTLPARTQDQATFDANMASLVANLSTFGSQFNAGVASFNAASSGLAYAIPYSIDLSGTTDVNPGNFKLRFDNATQNLATTLRLNVIGTGSVDYTSVLDTFDASTSTVKGAIRIVKQGDASKFLMFNVTARATPTGYRNISVTPVASSSANPFVSGDAVLLFFQRTGDVGAAGTQLRRTASIASSTTPTPDAGSTDLFSVTALAANATFGAPTGTVVDGQALMVRVKDNGTARTLAWNVIYNAGTGNALPGTTTAGKTLYVGFTYNASTVKWDLIAVLDNL